MRWIRVGQTEEIMMMSLCPHTVWYAIHQRRKTFFSLFFWIKKKSFISFKSNNGAAEREDDRLSYFSTVECISNLQGSRTISSHNSCFSQAVLTHLLLGEQNACSSTNHSSQRSWLVNEACIIFEPVGIRDVVTLFKCCFFLARHIFEVRPVHQCREHAMNVRIMLESSEREFGVWAPLKQGTLILVKKFRLGGTTWDTFPLEWSCAAHRNSQPPLDKNWCVWFTLVEFFLWFAVLVAKPFTRWSIGFLSLVVWCNLILPINED